MDHPPWFAPTECPWVEVPIHDRYGGPLPVLPVFELAENVAEKSARLNRRSPARDAYDLVSLARTPGLELDRDLIRRLAVLKFAYALEQPKSVNVGEIVVRSAAQP